MKKHVLALAMLLSCMYDTAQSQNTGSSPYYHTMRRRTAIPDADPQPNTSGQSGTGANYDVKYHKAFWRINPDSSVKYIRGFVQTNFRTITASVSSISFDLNAILLVDSVRFRGTRLPAGNITRVGNILTIALGTTLANNVLDSIWVFYRGTPPIVSGSAEGYQVGTDATTSQKYMYTLSESYEDRDWWPCKADMQDKIDSMDIIVSTPWSGADTFWVATNGVLMDSAISGGSRFFTFKTRYPITSYLVCVAVARYNRYYRPPVNISGTLVPVVYNLHRGKSAANYTTILNAMDAQKQVLAEFSTKFGDYPFKREKHGYYDGLGGAGGMEHQTFSAMSGGSTAGGIGSLASATTLAHELIHQWFGDKVSFATWADLWLAEGFARYGEALAGEFVPATGINPTAEMASAKTAARGVTTTPTRITSFTTSNQVWTSNNTRAVYDRGCMVLSMLRKLSGDTKFFQACRNYGDSATGSGYKSATTDTLKNHFERVLGYQLDAFFDDWVINYGHPSTVVNWNNPGGGTNLVVSVASQAHSVSSNVTYFNNVIVLRVQGALVAQDTLITIYDIDGFNLAKAGLPSGIGATVPGNGLSFNLSFVPTTVTFDPFSQTMSTGSTVKVTTLDFQVLDFYARRNGNYNEAFLTLDDNSSNTPVLIERSAEGIDFSTIGTMEQQSGAERIKRYLYRDFTPLAGYNYYRAKYKNLDGQYLYSKVVKLNNGRNALYSIVSNPASGTLLVKTNTAAGNRGNWQLRIYDAVGKLVIAETRRVQGELIRVNISKLTPGTYVFTMEAPGFATEMQKFVVE